jgi:hypothetical protein
MVVERAMGEDRKALRKLAEKSNAVTERGLALVGGG